MAVPLSKIYAFSNTFDAKFNRALASWRFMTGPSGVGLPGASASGGFETKRICTGTCPVCGENKPAPPSAGSTIRALQYSGNAQYCLGQTGAFTPIDDKWAHNSTTSNGTCSGSTPDTCWYLSIWDYLLTN